MIWKYRHKATGHFSNGGIDATFDGSGREFKNRIGAKGSLFHYVYGFGIDADGVRRFHPRNDRCIDDYEVVAYENGTEINVIQGREMFTHNELLNKQDRDLSGLSPKALAREMKKQF